MPPLPCFPSRKDRSMAALHNYSLGELEEKSSSLWELHGKMASRRPFYPDRFLTSPQLLTVLYFAYLNHDPQNPQWEERDRVFWSGGARRLLPLLALSHCGYFPIEKIGEAADAGASLMPGRSFPGVEARLGYQESVLGIAVGAALDARMSERSRRIVCLMDESEQLRGDTWEAAMTAGKQELGNLLLIVSRLRGTTARSATLCPKKVEALADKYAAFEWQVLLANGNNIKDIFENMPAVDSMEKNPTVMILDVEEAESHKPQHTNREKRIAEKIRDYFTERYDEVPAVVVSSLHTCGEYYPLSVAAGMALSGRSVVYVADSAALSAYRVRDLLGLCSEEGVCLTIVLSGDGPPFQLHAEGIRFESPGSIRGAEQSLGSIMRSRGVSILRWPDDQGSGVEETVSSYGEKN